MSKKPTRNIGAAQLLWAATAGVLLSLPAFPAPPPPAAFGRTPALTDVHLSPNGKLLVWAEAAQDAPVVVIYSLDQKKPLRKFGLGDVLKLRSMRWADDETVLVTVSQVRYNPQKPDDKLEYWRTQAVDVAGGAARTLLMDDNFLRQEYVTGAHLLNARLDTPHTVIMSTVDVTASKSMFGVDSRIKRDRRDSAWVMSVFSVDTKTGKGKRIDAGTPYTDDWLVDRSGNLVARTDWDPEQSIYRILVKNGSAWREIYSAGNRDDLEVVALSADNTFLYALGTYGQSSSKLWALPLDGSTARVEFEEPGGDVSSVVRDRFTNLPVAVHVGGPFNTLRWLDKAAEKKQEALKRAFPGMIVETYGRSAGRHAHPRICVESIPRANVLPDRLRRRQSRHDRRGVSGTGRHAARRGRERQLQGSRRPRDPRLPDATAQRRSPRICPSS